MDEKERRTMRLSAYKYNVLDIKPNDNPGAYDGTEPYVAPGCWSCRKQNVKFMCCSRCKVAYYCSKECHKRDYEGYHKKLCKALCKETKRAAELQQVPDELDNYIKAVKARTAILWEIATHYGHSYLWHVYIKGELEVLRQRPMHPHDGRDTVVFKFLLVNRDEECYSFIKWYLTKEFFKTDESERPLTKPGDWIYLKDQDIYEDLFLWSPDRYNCRLCFLLGMAIIKLRLIAYHKAVAARWQAFLSLCLVDEVGIVLNIEEYLCGTSFAEFTKRSAPQEAIAKKWLLLLHKENEYVLPGLLDKHWLLTAPNPPRRAHCGAEARAWYSAIHGYKFILRIPGAWDFVKDFMKIMTRPSRRR